MVCKPSSFAALILVATLALAGAAHGAAGVASDHDPFARLAAAGEPSRLVAQVGVEKKGDRTATRRQLQKFCEDWEAKDKTNISKAAQDKIRIGCEKLKRIDNKVPLIELAGPATVQTISPGRFETQVDAGDESYIITGFVGDDGGKPVLTHNGAPLALVDPGAATPNLGKHTFAFSRQVEITKEGEKHYHLFEAVDAAGHRSWAELVVRVVASDRPQFKGAYHALVIGNSDYKNLPKVPTAVNDAKALAEVLRRRYVFDENNITLLLNASRGEILKGIDGFKNSLELDDRLLIYYSGHGQIDEATQEGFWLGTDAEENADYTWIAIDDVRRRLKGMTKESAKHVLVIADSVFPLTVSRGAHGQGRDRFFDQIDDWVTRKMISSGVATPTADDKSGNHSVFAYSLLKVLRENREPYITSKQLFEKLARALPSDQKPKWGTVSNTGDEGSGEFTFILRAKPLAASGG